MMNTSQLVSSTSFLSTCIHCSQGGMACVHSWVVVIRPQEEAGAMRINLFLSLIMDENNA